MRILVVEDEARLARQIASALTEAGHDPIVVHDGERALREATGTSFTRKELCERVWEHEHEYDTKLVEVFVGRLRKKIGDPPLIHTVRYVGYTIHEPARPSS